MPSSEQNRMRWLTMFCIEFLAPLPPLLIVECRSTIQPVASLIVLPPPLPPDNLLSSVEHWVAAISVAALMRLGLVIRPWPYVSNSLILSANFALLLSTRSLWLSPSGTRLSKILRIQTCWTDSTHLIAFSWNEILAVLNETKSHSIPFILIAFSWNEILAVLNETKSQYSVH